MSKVTITFTLPDERLEHADAIHGSAWRYIVYELSMFLRNKLKHGHEFKNADQALEAVKEQLWLECKDANLDPWQD